MGKNPVSPKAVAVFFAAVLLAPGFALAQPASASPASRNDAIASSSAAGARVENRALARLVKRTLRRSSALTTTNITVRANGGVVTLLGTVPTSEQVTQAENIAAAVPGVTSVTNRLTVNPIQGRPDGH